MVVIHLLTQLDVSFNRTGRVKYFGDIHEVGTKGNTTIKSDTYLCYRLGRYH